MTQFTDPDVAIVSSLYKAHAEAKAKLQAIRAAIRDAKTERDLLNQELATLRQACNEARQWLFVLHNWVDFVPPRSIN
jgi:hypothetical protein